MLVDREIGLERARICASCEELFKPTFTCKQCLCFMKIKVKIPNAYCPLGKWDAVEIEDEFLNAPDPNTRPEPNNPE